MTKRLPFAIALLTLCATFASAQPLPKDDELHRTIAALDAKMFDAYNTCDLETFGALFDENVEFYHDQGGPMTGRKGVVEAVKKYICGKVRRELVSMEVFPMKDFGAVEMGVHRFTHPGHDDTEAVGEARFFHLWQKKDGVWRVTRVISYDHHALAKN